MYKPVVICIKKHRITTVLSYYVAFNPASALAAVPGYQQGSVL